MNIKLIKPHSDETKKLIKKRKILYDNLILGELIPIEVTCSHCSKAFLIEEREKQFPKKEKYYCSRKCANSRSFSDEAKRKKGLKSKAAWEDGRCKPCIINHGKFRFSSKGEEEIRNYFIGKFPEDEWTFGGGIKIEEKRISRDLYSNKLKVCIEYDGIWHFKDIKGQLKKKQYKDFLLEKWCIENNYRLIRIKEEIYLKDKINLLNLVVNEVYEGENLIVKFY